MGAIVARAPLRVALGGGGTDLPSYYRRARRLRGVHRHRPLRAHAGVGRLPAALPPEAPRVGGGRPARREVRHPILREVLTRHWDGPPVELASVSDAPPGTGLGSSGAYTVCAIKALRAAAGAEPAAAAELAEAACEIEIDVLERSVGKQDQYAAAFGGVRAYTFHRDDSVDVRALSLPEHVERALRDDFLLFFTGRERSASDVLSGQVSGTASGDESVRRALDRLHELGRADLRGARGRRPRPLRRADERPVGRQARPRARHGDRRDGRAARAGARRRRARRRVARCRRRRVRARLHAGPRAHPAARSPTCASCASAPIRTGAWPRPRRSRALPPRVRVAPAVKLLRALAPTLAPARWPRPPRAPRSATSRATSSGARRSPGCRPRRAGSRRTPTRAATGGCGAATRRTSRAAG